MVTLLLGWNVLFPVWAQEPSSQPDVYELRASAWDRSVAREKAGDLAGAREVLLNAFGSSPEGYEVTVRLAWLSLQMGDSDQAIGWYRRAISLEGSGPEARQGLASAHEQRGFRRLDRADRPGAREDFGAALDIDPKRDEARRGLDLVGPASRVDPELWFALLRQNLPGDSYTAGAVFLHLPWQLEDHLTLRFAYRYVGSEDNAPTQSSSPGSPGSGRKTASSGLSLLHHHELYAGGGVTSAYVDAEVLGIGVFPSDEDPAPGAGLRLRAGSSFGVLVEAAALHRERGWNRQVVPGLYFWPSPVVGLAAGMRYTVDDVGSAPSGWVGLSLARDRTEFHVRVHRGTERWAFSASEPSILSIDPETTVGAKAALLLPLSRTWQIGIQAQFERLRDQDRNGAYVGASTGLRWSPALQ
jgi:tetratricopeptide (TPR) repeat protein